MIRIPKTRSKYHAEPTIVDGIRFASHKEARYYLQLRQLQKAGEVIGIECQPVFELQPAYWKCCGEVSTNKASKHTCHYCGKKIPAVLPITYIADFRVEYADGHEEIVDTKGIKTRTFLDKKKMFEFHYPELTLKVIGGKRK
jgi:hypothetical protein